jgi:hypothetical protein
MTSARTEAIRPVPSAQRTPSPRGGEGRGEGAPAFQNILPNLPHIARRANLDALIIKQTRIVHRVRSPLTPTLSPKGRGGALWRRRLSDRLGHDSHDGDLFAGRREAIKGLPSARRTPSPRGGEGWGEGVPAFQNILANVRHMARHAKLGAVTIKQTRIVLRVRRPLTPTLSPTGRGGALCERRLPYCSRHHADEVQR